jgi:hypothetical protein
VSIVHVDSAQDLQNVTADLSVLNQRDALTFLGLVVLVKPLIDQKLCLLQVDLEIIALSLIVHDAEP